MISDLIVKKIELLSCVTMKLFGIPPRDFLWQIIGLFVVFSAMITKVYIACFCPSHIQATCVHVPPYYSCG